MTRFLLDINVLIALIDPMHMQHGRAHHWFASTAKKAWATCPITEVGTLRIVVNRRYPASPGTPAVVARLLASLRNLPGHELWPDHLSLLDTSIVNPARMLDSSHVTDTYLLALAAARHGKLATFDRGIVTGAVHGGAAAIDVIG